VKALRPACKSNVMVRPLGGLEEPRFPAESAGKKSMLIDHAIAEEKGTPQ
jgi:hypothetical protein